MTYMLLWLQHREEAGTDAHAPPGSNPPPEDLRGAPPPAAGAAPGQRPAGAAPRRAARTSRRRAPGRTDAGGDALARMQPEEAAAEMGAHLPTYQA